MNLNESILIEAFTASILNYERCSVSDNKKRGIIYKIKYIIWFILLVLLSPKYKDNSDGFVACMTPINERRMKQFRPTKELYRFAKLNASVSAIKRNISVVSGYTYTQRLRIVFDSITFYLNNRNSLKGYLHFTLEYYAIAKFLNDHRFKEYITPGMYERYCTLFSYLGKIYGAKIIGVQDGAAVDIGVPAKLYCDEMFVFDEYEAAIIKKFIKNDDCKFRFTGFESVLTWHHLKKRNKKVLAIASQDWFTQKTLELINGIMSSPVAKVWDVVIFPHYRESMESYEKAILLYPNLIVEPEKRFDNVDLLVTFYSTIVYDFWAINNELTVFCLQIPGYEPGYYGRKNVKVFSGIDSLAQAISLLENT